MPLSGVQDKPYLSGLSKIDKTKILMINGSLMKVKSIAECSPWSILQYFGPALTKIDVENQFLVILRVAILDRYDCTIKRDFSNLWHHMGIVSINSDLS